MTKPPQNARYWLAMLWLGLLLAGCLSQMNLLQGPKPGSGAFAPEAVSLVKPNPQGTGNWVSTPDGRTQLTVRIGMTQPPVGSFATKKLDLTAIAKVTATIALATGGTTVAPTNADAAGFVAAPSGSFALTFPPVDKGTKRTLTITGFTAAGIPVGSAVIKSLFDNTADTGSFEISYRTTPTATVFQGLGATAAATVTTSSLQAAVDAITGYAGTTGVYPQCPPALVDTALMITNLNASGGDTAPIIAGPVTYRQAGTELSHSFFLPPTPVAADMPQLFCSDPSTEVFDLAPLAGSTGTFNSTNNTVTATIAANGQVQVTFHKVPPGTWKIGAKLPGDGTTPNPKYFQVAANVCGSVATLTVGGASQTAFTSEAFRAAEPTYVSGQIRWLKTNTVGGFKVQDLTTSLPTAVSAMSAGDSSDFAVYVGPSVGYTFTGTLTMPAGVTNLSLLGPASVAEASRPKLIFGTTDQIYLTTSSQAVRDLQLTGARVNVGGGTLQRVTVEGQRIAAGSGAAITVAGSANFLLDTVHVYDVRHTAVSPTVGTDALVGIAVNTTGSGQILNSLVDDKASNSGTFSIRYAANASPASLAGIAVQAAAGITIANTNVIAIGRMTGTGLTPTQTVAGIVSDAASGVRITNCTVGNVEANADETGMGIKFGTVANCVVENLQTPASGANSRITGLRIGEGGGRAEAKTNTVRLLGESSPVTPGLRVTGIEAVAPAATNTVIVDQNQVTNSGGEVFTGLQVRQNPGSPSTFIVANNTVSACRSRDVGGAAFYGVDTMGPGSPFPNLTIQHNDISGNILFGTGFGIRAQADSSSNTLNLINNRIATNTCSSTSGGAYSQDFTMVYAGGSGATNTTVKDNLITGNQLLDNTGASQPLSFTGVMTAGPNDAIENNVLSGNTLNSSAGDTGSVFMIALNTAGKVFSNRIFDNALDPSYPSAKFYRAIHANTATASITIDRNIIADTALGKSANWPAIQLGLPIGTTGVVRHNSVKMADSFAPAIAIVGNNGNCDVANNAMTTAANTGSSAAVSRSIVAAGTPTVDGNWINGWPTLFATMTGTNTVTGSPVFGTSSGTVNVGSHLMGTNGTTGFNGGVIGAEGTYATVLALSAAPAY